MKRHNFEWQAILIVILLVINLGCGAVGGGRDDDDPDGDNADGDSQHSDGDMSEDDGGLTIYDIQDESRPDHPFPDTNIELKGVIATSEKILISPSSNLRGFFIAEPAGGEYGGILVVMKGEIDFDPNVGEKLNVSGKYVEFCGTGDTPDDVCSSQIEATQVNFVSGGHTAPAAELITDPSSIATGGTNIAAWEHSLVRVDSVTVTNPDMGYGEFEITGGLLVDDMIYKLPVVAGQEFPFARGFLYVAFGNSKLEPRGPEDFGAEPQPTDLKIADIQNPDSENHPMMGAIEVKGIVVTSDPFEVSSSGLMGIFVADIGGGPWAGCMLTWKPTSAEPEYGYDPPAMSPGMVIDVTGSYSEFCGIQEPYYTSCSTQIELTPFQADLGTVTDTGETADVPDAAVVTPAKVQTGGEQAEQWQHSLIQVNNVTVTNPDLGYGEFELNASLVVDDQLYQYPYPDLGDTFVYIKGYLTTSYDEFKLLPRDEDDLLEGEIDGDIDFPLVDGDEVDGDVEIDIDDGALVINELKYDEPSDDTGIDMFIEIYGPAGQSLNGCSLVGINGSDGADYITFDLNGESIPNDNYFVVANNNAEGNTAANADLQFADFDPQNSPDSFELRCGGDVIDTVCYKSAEYDADKPFLSPCEGSGHAPDAFATQSVARRPDHNDTNNNGNDFGLCETPTPGESNDSCFNIVDGDVDGDEPDGDEPDGDEPDGDEPDGDIVDGDTDNAVDPGAIVINELKYDDPGSDTGAGLFAELLGTPGQSLDACELVGINGFDSAEYGTFDLSGNNIPGDGYFVAAHSAAAGAVSAAADLLLPGFDLQNSPDSLLLRCSGVSIDLVGYKNISDDIDPAAYEGSSPADDSRNEQSLARNPNGVDTDENSTDFAICEVPTPGSSNDPCFVVDGDIDGDTDGDEAPGGCDISGWTIHQLESEKSYTFAANTLIPAGGLLVLSRNSDQAAFESYWSTYTSSSISFGADVVFVNGGTTVPQINGDETYEIKDASQVSIDGPTVAMPALDDESIHRLDSSAAASVEGSWSRLLDTAATPGSSSMTTNGSAGVVISEFADAGSGDTNYNYEFVEIFCDASK